MASKNLGFVQAIKSGTTAPTNTQQIWYDTNVGAHKVYDTGTLTWILLGSGAGIDFNTPQTEDTTTGSIDWEGAEIWNGGGGSGVLTITDSNLVKGKRIIIELTGWSSITLPAYWQDTRNGKSLDEYISTETSYIFAQCRESTGGSEDVLYEMTSLYDNTITWSGVSFDSSTGLSTTQVASTKEIDYDTDYIYHKVANNYWLRTLIVKTTSNPF